MAKQLLVAGLLVSGARAALRDAPPALQADSSVESCSRVVVIWVSSMTWFLALGFLPWFAHAFRIVQHAAVQTSKNGASIPSMDDLQELRFCVLCLLRNTL